MYHYPLDCVSLTYKQCISSLFFPFFVFHFSFRDMEAWYFWQLWTVWRQRVMASCPPLCLSLYLSISSSEDRGFTLGAFWGGKLSAFAIHFKKINKIKKPGVCRKALAFSNDNHDLYHKLHSLEVIILFVGSNGKSPTSKQCYIYLFCHKI